MIYQINQFKLDTDQFSLTTKGQPIAIEPKVFNLLVHLISHRDQIVTRDHIQQCVWNGRLVSDTSINNHIKSARQALGDDGTQQQVIKTIHSRGYQFIAPVKCLTRKQSHSQQSQLRLITAAVGLMVLLLAAVFIGFYANPEQGQSAADPTLSETQIQLAVLPFTNSKPDPKHDFLGVALSSQVIAELRYFERFSITPATAVRKYSQQDPDPIKVAESLGVDYLVTGSYLVENKQIRLQLEMIDLKKHRLDWAKTFQVNYANTFDLQDEVVRQVIAGLHADLENDQITYQANDRPTHALAYELFLRAIAYPYTNEGHKLAIPMLLKAIEMDPGFAPSYAYLGSHRRLLEQHGRETPHGLKKAEWYYLKALELNPNQLIAMSNLAVVYTETNRIEQAFKLTQKMLKINPQDASLYFSLGYIYRYAGMLDESIAAMEKALEISPDNPRFRSIVATYLSAKQYQQAQAKLYLDTGEYGIGYGGIIAFEQQQFPQARKHFEQLLAINPDDIWGLIATIYLAFMEGDQPKGLAALERMIDTDIVDAENTFYFAEFYALLDQQELALDWLEQAVDSGYFNYPGLVSNSAFDFAKSQPRYQAIINKAKQRHDAFRKEYMSK